MWKIILVVVVSTQLCGCGLNPLGLFAECLNPAPLVGQPDGAAPGYVVVFRDGTNPIQVTAQLEQKYGFKAKYVWQNVLLGFSAEFTTETREKIRCESSVKYMEFDQHLTVN
jgi:hypothetical protein